MQVIIHANGIAYVLVSNFYVPDSLYSYQGEYIGYYGNKRLEYILQDRKDLYYRLQDNNNLLKHLVETNERIIERKEQLLKALIIDKDNPEHIKRIHDACLRVELDVLNESIYS